MSKKILTLVLACVITLSQVSFASAGEVTSENGKLIKGDWLRQYCATLYQDNKLNCDSTNTDALELKVDEKSQSLVISGAKADVMAASIIVDKEFDFSETSIGRFSLLASAAKGQKITLGAYLDDEKDPFFTTNLIRQKKKNDWTYSKDISANISGLQLTGKHKIRFKVLEANSSDVSFSIDCFEFVKTSIPVIYFDIDETEGSIDAMNNSIDHTDECYGTMNIEIPEGYVSEYSGKTLDTNVEGYDESFELEYIRGRGNSTWGTGKNPYKIKLDTSASVLGLPKNKHWVLLANYYDNSLLRNKITYWLGDEVGMAYSPRSEFVDVVMNGEYYGSYQLCEQVRVDKNRVKIDDLEKTPEATDEETISGGYLLSMFPGGDEDEKKSFKTNGGIEFLIESPQFEDTVNETQVEYIKNYCNKIEEALNGDDFKSEDGVRYSELMDVESAAMYYMFQEFSMNGDGYCSGSTYLYKKRDGKLYWGPLWDFDYVAWGSTEYEEPSTEGWIQQNGAWNQLLLSDKQFTDTLGKSWEKYKDAIDELIKEGGQLDKYSNQLKISAEYNFEALADNNAYEDALSFDEEVERLRSWITDREAWVGKNIKSLTPKEIEVSYYTEDGKLICTVKELENRELRKIPEAPAKKGKTFIGWAYTIEMSFEEYLDYLGLEDENAFIELFKELGLEESEIQDVLNDIKTNGFKSEGIYENGGIAYRNMKLTAQYIDNDEIVDVEKIYTLRNNYYDYHYEDNGYGHELYIPFSYSPYDASITNIKYISSDDTVLKVDEDNCIQIVGPGDAKITLQAENGVSKTVNVHIYSEKELDEDFDYDYYVSSFRVSESMTIKDGEYKQLCFELENENGIMGDNPMFYSSDYDVVSVDDVGVVHAEGTGSAIIACLYNYEISFCKVTVSKNPLKVGTVHYVGGKKYKITKSNAKQKRVEFCGVYNTTKKGNKTVWKKNKSVKTVNVPASVKIKGKTFEVRSVSNGAFSGCKKLKTVKLLQKNKMYISKNVFAKASKRVKLYVKKDLKKYYSDLGIKKARVIGY